MAKTFGSLGFEAIIPLTKYVSCVLLGLAIQAFVVYPGLLVILTRLNPLKFLQEIFLRVMFFAFSSSTSNATIPLNIEKPLQNLAFHVTYPHSPFL